MACKSKQKVFNDWDLTRFVCKIILELTNWCFFLHKNTILGKKNVMLMAYIFSSTQLNEARVFCYQNCFDLLWEQNWSSEWEKLFKFKAEGREFAKFLRLLEQFIQTMKGHINFW